MGDFQCLLKYMIICAFENSPSIPSFLVTKILYIGYGQLKKWLLFLLPYHSCVPCIFISYCCWCLCQAVCFYYMPVPTKYHWNISFQKKCSSKYVVKNARNITQFWFRLFFSCLRRRGRRYKRGSDITIFFPNIAFYFFTTIKWICSIVS
jgi:hypothetical protein